MVKKSAQIYEARTQTLMIILEIDIVQCNHICRCLVDNDVCPTQGHA